MGLRTMTQPYYPQQPIPQQQPMYPQYPQAPAQPPAASYPQQPMYSQPTYQQPPPPPQPLATGSLADFFGQPSTGGGPVFSWKGKPIGTTYAGVVSRPITSADVQQQTMPGGNVPAFYRDGRPKFLMKVPMRVVPSPEFPDGEAQWWVSGRARDELARAMSEAGCEPNMSPEAGALISITLTGERPSGPGMNNAKTVAVQYTRPQGAQPASIPMHGEALAADIQRQMQQAQPAQPQPPQVPMQQQVPPMAQPQPPYQQPTGHPTLHVPQQVQPPQVPIPQQVQPSPPTQPLPQQANDLNPEQQALLAQLVNK